MKHAPGWTSPEASASGGPIVAPADLLRAHHPAGRSTDSVAKAAADTTEDVEQLQRRRDDEYESAVQVMGGYKTSVKLLQVAGPQLQLPYLPTSASPWKPADSVSITAVSQVLPSKAKASMRLRSLHMQPQQQPSVPDADGTDLTELPEIDDSQLADEVCIWPVLQPLMPSILVLRCHSNATNGVVQDTLCHTVLFCH